MDGTERLCQALYGRAAKPSDYLGGSNAQMLCDAASLIVEAREAVVALRNYVGAAMFIKDNELEDIIQNLEDITAHIK